MILLVYRYVVNGAQWAGFSGNKDVYSSGRLTRGAIYDRNGTLLYDAVTGSYNEDSVIRTSTLHVVGDREGKIATSVQTEFGELLCGFSPITGTSGDGNDLYLTVDAEINKVAYQAMGNYKGTVAVYNYLTGEIVCLVSTPSYDPDNVPTITDGDETYEGVYLNRFYSSTYTPGSTMKVVTLAAAIETLPDLYQQTFTCTGSTVIDGEVVNCAGVHGTQDIATAFANSCNVAFALLSDEIGGEALEQKVTEAGFLERHSVSGITTGAGYFALTGRDVDLAWAGIGQAEDLVNPCAMLRLMGAIANGGTPVEPRILGEKTGFLGISQTFSGETGERIWSASTCEALKTMMRNNVVSHYGQDRFGSLNVCAKTGTAEVGTTNPHSWFTGFVDDEENPYAFVVVVENSGSGSAVAGTVAATVLNALAG
jgi:peptidoglycan glycosyltransferase